ncbi:alpha/beta hydrolase [Nocardioides cynanchi]|uniref:alpha/beta hydrolase n=1 Tax=Nocardioides cynanchi TaxID=2558918 RepID=UPI001244A643|nr:alpha/beta hydrolase [Nocardioides cynanchi]
MPSLRHQVLARVVPRVRRSRELDDEASERARIERWHEELDRSLPTGTTPRFHRRFSVVTETLPGGSPSYSVVRRGTLPSRTVLYLHGGAFMAPMSAWQVTYAARMADDLDARVVLPDYPLAPEHTWRDSHRDLVELAERLATGDELVIAGDSSGGGLALAIAESMRDRGGPQARRLLLVSPWVDLTTSTPETAALDAVDPWLFIGKVRAYAAWWAGSPGDLGRPEVSPALGDLSGLPPALMFCGSRDLLVPGCRLLARRAAEAGWDLTYVEEPDLIHVYPLLPLIPEARRAWRRTVEFLRD